MLFNGKTAAGLLAVIIALASAVSCGDDDNNGSKKKKGSRVSISDSGEAAASLDWNGKLDENNRVEVDGFVYEIKESKYYNDKASLVDYKLPADAKVSDDGYYHISAGICATINGIPVGSVLVPASDDMIVFDELRVPDSVGDSWNKYYLALNLSNTRKLRKLKIMKYSGDIVCKLSGVDIESLEIENGIRSVPAWFLYEVGGVSEVVLPESVERIEIENDPSSIPVFAGCPDMKSVTILNPNFDFGNSFLDIIVYNNYNLISANSIYNGTLRGYKGSTTEAYAKKYGMTFEAID